jgi:HAD superfamily hydrolase (TIGR01490 family)
VNDSSDNAPTDVGLSQGPDAPSGEGSAAPAVAFFDLDGTLVVGQTTVMLVKFLRRSRVVSRTFMVLTGLWFFGYKVGLIKVSEKSRETGASVFKGQTEEKVDSLMARFAEEILMPRLHPASKAALAEHLAEGDHVVLISAALEPAVKGLCRCLGVDDYAGTACEVVEGRYSGRLMGPSPHADEKVRVAADYMARWGADPADCWAYADHETDLSLLRSVGHPVAVNPRPALLEEAQKAGWPIIP